MLEQLNLENILFLDIETVPQQNSFDALNADEKKMWEDKAQFLKKEENENAGTVYNRAGIYAGSGFQIARRLIYSARMNPTGTRQRR